MRKTRRATTAVAVAGLSLLAGCSQTSGAVPGVSDSPDAWWTASPSAKSESPSSKTATQTADAAPATAAPAPAAASGPCGYAVAGKAARPVDMPPSGNIEKLAPPPLPSRLMTLRWCSLSIEQRPPAPRMRSFLWPSRVITTTLRVTSYLREILSTSSVVTLPELGMVVRDTRIRLRRESRPEDQLVRALLPWSPIPSTGLARNLPWFMAIPNCRIPSSPLAVSIRTVSKASPKSLIRGSLPMVLLQRLIPRLARS